MSKKSTKTEDIVEALCDDRVVETFTSRMQDKVIKIITDQLDIKFKEIWAELKKDILRDVEKMLTGSINDSLSNSHKQISTMEERINNLENINLQKDLLIFGIKDNKQGSFTDETTDPSLRTSDSSLFDLVSNQILNDLNIHIERNEINHIIRLKSKPGFKTPPPILISFVSTSKRNDILHTSKFKRKQHLKNPPFQNTVYYNERQSKSNAEISYTARTMVRDNKIASTWIFKGETYIKKTSTSNPVRITKLDKLREFD